jgi:hypothetical protein
MSTPSIPPLGSYRDPADTIVDRAALHIRCQLCPHLTPSEIKDALDDFAAEVERILRETSWKEEY